MIIPFSLSNPYFVGQLASNISVGYAASGGEISLLEADGYAWQVHTFNSPDSLVAYRDLVDVEYLIVGGGGGGGYGGYHGGGGGAGGLITNIGAAVSLAPSRYFVRVGDGGPGGLFTVTTAPAQGWDSGFNSIYALGGGAGGRQGVSGAVGGSGGGAGYGGAGGAGIVGQGSAGGGGVSGLAYGSGGGGGAGGVGQNGTTLVGGSGGIGALVNITGTPTYYAGGGGGSAYDGPPGSGGLGGGGSGARATALPTVPSAGSPNTGGGGGGAERASTTGGAGGSGVVIIRHRVSLSQEIPPPEYTDPSPVFDLSNYGFSTVYNMADTESYPGTGLTLYDLSANGNDAQLNAGVTYADGALIFSGPSQFPQAKFNAFNSNTYFTLFARLEYHTNIDFAMLGPSTPGPTGGALVWRYVGSSSQFQVVSSYVAIRAAVSYSWAANTDIVVALRNSGAGFTFYVNGVSIGTVATATTFTSVSKYTLGSDSDGVNGANTMYGKYRRFAHFSAGLSDSEILKISEDLSQ